MAGKHYQSESRSSFSALNMQSNCQTMKTYITLMRHNSKLEIKLESRLLLFISAIT